MFTWLEFASQPQLHNIKAIIFKRTVTNKIEYKDNYMFKKSTSMKKILVFFILFILLGY